MGDYDDYSDYRGGSSGNSGGIIGDIIGLLILAAIWPYILAGMALYFLYLASVAILEWIAQNPFTVVGILLGTIAFYVIFRYRLIPRAWKALVKQLQRKPTEVDLLHLEIEEEMPKLAERKFLPFTNLYCYWCTKKLGIKAWEKDVKYYCQSCYQGHCGQKLDFE